MAPKWPERPFSPQSCGSVDPGYECPSTNGQAPGRRWEVYQENGQKKYGPPADWTGPPPPRGTEIFVSRLPRFCTEDDLIPVFQSVGELYEFRLMMDFSGSNRGYCFVKYATVEMAALAVSQLDDTLIPGYSGPTILVEESVDNCKLFIMPVPEYSTDDGVAAHIGRYVLGVKGAEVKRSKSTGDLYCFLEFENHKMAAMGRRELLSSGIPDWKLPDVKLDWAVPQGKKVRQEKQKHRLYIQNLTWDEPAAEVQYILDTITVNMRSVISYRKVDNVGVVDLKSRPVGEYIVAKLNGARYDDGYLRVSWSCPPNLRIGGAQRRGIRREDTDSDWSTITYSTVDPSDYSCEDSSALCASFDSELSCSSLPSPPSGFNSSGSSNEGQYFVPRFEVDQSKLFTNNDSAQGPKPSRPVKWWREDQGAALQKEQPAVQQSGMTPQRPQPPVNYDGFFTITMSDGMTVRLMYLQPCDGNAVGLPPSCYTVYPNHPQPDDGATPFDILETVEQEFCFPRMTNVSRLRHVCTTNTPAVYGLPDSFSTPSLADGPARAPQQLGGSAGTSSDLPNFFARGITTVEEYNEFKEFLQQLFVTFPNDCYPILEGIVEGLGWGVLRAEEHYRRMDGKVAVTLYLQQPNRLIAIWCTFTYYDSPRQAKDEAASCFIQSHLLIGPYFFLNNQQRFKLLN